MYGTEYTPEELHAEIIKDKAFYTVEMTEYTVNNEKALDKLPGGVTFS